MRKMSNRIAIKGPRKGTRLHSQIRTARGVNRNCICARFSHDIKFGKLKEEKSHQYINVTLKFK